MTQHNAALVEEAARGAAGLATEADNLVATVSLFKLSRAEKQQKDDHKVAQLASNVAPRNSPAMLLPSTT
jgi:hypothetical protein